MEIGRLAASTGKNLPVEVLESYAGFYIGTLIEDADFGCKIPYTRESERYWPTRELAATALNTGDWTQKRSL